MQFGLKQMIMGTLALAAAPGMVTSPVKNAAEEPMADAFSTTRFADDEIYGPFKASLIGMHHLVPRLYEARVAAESSILTLNKIAQDRDDQLYGPSNALLITEMYYGFVEHFDVVMDGMEKLFPILYDIERSVIEDTWASKLYREKYDL